MAHGTLPHWLTPEPTHLHHDVLWIQPRQDDVEADHHGIPAGAARRTIHRFARQSRAVSRRQYGWGAQQGQHLPQSTGVA
jgi:hypothetical protein